jgi:hypothetical protein
MYFRFETSNLEVKFYKILEVLNRKKYTNS